MLSQIKINFLFYMFGVINDTQKTIDIHVCSKFERMRCWIFSNGRESGWECWLALICNMSIIVFLGHV